MKKFIRFFLISCILYVPVVFADTNFCETSGVLKSLKIVYYILTILKIMAPLIIIITGMISLFKAFVSESDVIKEKVYLLIEKVFIGAFVFLLPTCIYNIISSFSFSSVLNDFSVCNECLFNKSSCDGLIDNALIMEQLKIEKYNATVLKLKEAVENAKKLTNNNTENTQTGTFIGQRYNLTETELLQIANQCAHEQGSSVGAAAEASLMANRYELFGKKYSSLYSYVKTSKWWANSKKNMSGSPKVNSSVVEAVRQVLVYGNRTLPYYVDEHDCIKCGKNYDVVSATNYGKPIDRNNRSLYISGVTIIKNRYTATYTFYCFPTKNSDPFGYTSSAYNKYQKMKG